MTRDEVAKLAVLSGFEHLDELLKLTRPTVALVPRKRAKMGILASRLGGVPALPQGVPWPTRNGRSLAFVAQVAMNEMPASVQRQGFPKTGILSFFYDAVEGPWGFDPEDAGCSAVLYAPDPRATGVSDWPADLPASCKYPACRLVAEETVTIPNWESVIIDEMKLAPAELDRYVEIADKWTSIQAWANRSLLGGYPDQIQSDMMLQAELVSTGITGDDLRKDPRMPFFRRRAMRWRHLFQLQSYEPAGMNWGDAGCLYYWLRESDLIEQNFSAGWMILQCG